MASARAPIAVFAYRRVGLLKRMFASLRNCDGFEESRITIFVDGPKSNQDAADVEAVRNFVRSIDLPNVTAAIRDSNLGLKRSIFTGVSELCMHHGRAVVLEDDLILSPVVLDYFNEGLERYRDEERVWNIVGYMYDVPQFHDRREAVFLPFTHPWGWATWDRAWSQFDLEEDIAPEHLVSRSFRTAFDAYGVRDFSQMLEMETRGQVNSWFVRWYYRMFREGGVSAFPPRTLVKNLGIGGRNGTHASILNPYRLLVSPELPIRDQPSFPRDISLDYQAVDQIRASWDARVQRMISWLGRMKRKARRVFC